MMNDTLRLTWYFFCLFCVAMLSHHLRVEFPKYATDITWGAVLAIGLLARGQYSDHTR